jgi:hypothetical protein
MQAYSNQREWDGWDVWQKCIKIPERKRKFARYKYRLGDDIIKKCKYNMG